MTCDFSSLAVFYITGTGNAASAAGWVADEAVKAEMALLLPAFILFMKGYKCIGFRPVDLPSNWIILHPGVRREVVSSIYNHWEVNVRSFARKILSGKKVWRGLYSFPVDIALVPVALGYYLAGRFFLSKTFVAGTGCNLCGLCIKECPTRSIRLVDGRPYWKLTCESCMKCLNRCPERAIQTTHGLAVAFWLIISSLFGIIFPAFVKIGGIEQNALWWKVIEQLLRFGVLIATVWAVYLIIHYIQRFKPFRYVIEYTSLSRFSFWRRYLSPLYKKKTVTRKPG